LTSDSHPRLSASIAMLDPKSLSEAFDFAVCVLSFLPSDLRAADEPVIARVLMALQAD
jgi:hypothetical protein